MATPPPIAFSNLDNYPNTPLQIMRRRGEAIVNIAVESGSGGVSRFLFQGSRGSGQADPGVGTSGPRRGRHQSCGEGEWAQIFICRAHCREWWAGGGLLSRICATAAAHCSDRAGGGDGGDDHSTHQDEFSPLRESVSAKNRIGGGNGMGVMTAKAFGSRFPADMRIVSKVAGSIVGAGVGAGANSRPCRIPTGIGCCKSA